MKRTILLTTILLFFGSKLATAQKTEAEKHEGKETKKEIVKKKRPVAIENGKFSESNGKKMLYGEENKNQHFDISGYVSFP